jgi:hypothetical protein
MVAKEGPSERGAKNPPTKASKNLLCLISMTQTREDTRRYGLTKGFKPNFIAPI